MFAVLVAHVDALLIDLEQEIASERQRVDAVAGLELTPKLGQPGPSIELGHARKTGMYAGVDSLVGTTIVVWSEALLYTVRDGKSDDGVFRVLDYASLSLEDGVMSVRIIEQTGLISNPAVVESVVARYAHNFLATATASPMRGL